MKKMIALLLAALLLFSLAACGAEQKPEDNGAEVGMANPLVEVESLEKLNELGGKLCHPGVMGVTDEKYFIIGDTVADYRFSVNGVSYNWRFSAQKDNDICGIYGENGTLFFDKAEVTELQFAEGDDRAARWVNDEGQYTLTVRDGEIEAATFEGIATELSLITKAN